MCKYTENTSLSTSSTTDKDLTKDQSNVSQDELDMSNLFKMMEEERVSKLRRSLRKLFKSKVIPLCSKNLNLDTGSVMEIQEESLDDIINDMIDLGEQEPYGVNGGTLCLHFGSSLDDLANTPSTENRVGKFQVSQANVSTYELHLTLVPSTLLKHKVANLVRRFQAKPPVMVVDTKYKLDKKKLYRS